MTHEEILNLLSEHQLSMSTLDFLEQVKFKKYDIETLDKFTLIAHVNNNPSLQKKYITPITRWVFVRVFRFYSRVIHLLLF